MKRANTIRQFISLQKLSIDALSLDYLSALKVREHDAKRGLEGAFGRFRHRHPVRPGETHSEQRRNELRRTLIALATLAEPPPTA